ncbi:MAG: glycosyltransferase family 4 protein [Planctomycetota bacterium]
MRVLVLAEYPSLNGGERSFLEAARRITASDVQIVVAAPALGPLAQSLRRYNLPHVPFEPFDDRGARYGRPRLREQIADCMAHSRAELLHANSLSMSRLAGPVGAALGVPGLGHLRDMMGVSRVSVEDLNQHRCLLAVSQATRQWYVDAGLDESKVRVAYNGVDGRRFRPRPPRGVLHQALNIPRQCMLVGSVGQIGMRKGVDLYVDAAARIASRRSDVHFIHVGQRYSRKQEAVAFEEDVLRAANRGPLQGRFHFLGPRDGVERVLNEFDVYVHSARQEPLGRVLLEAGASGLPIVATEVGGTREIFPRSDDAALLVAPQSSVALGDAVEMLLSSPAARRAIGANARRRVTTAFDIHMASRQLEYWYRHAGALNRSTA